MRARYLLDDDGIVNLGYRYRRDLLEQADFSFLYPINRTWSVVGRYYYSILDEKKLESHRRRPVGELLPGRAPGRPAATCATASGELNNSLQFEFELKGLGSAGQNTERALRRAILGYDRDDLYLVPPLGAAPKQQRRRRQYHP